MMERSHIMMGSLSNFTLRDVLDVVGLSRQHTVVELRDKDGSNVASINVKGGHLVQCASDEQDPREALRRALQAPPRCTFHVFRLEDIGTYRSYGQLGEILAEDLSAVREIPQPQPAAAPVRAVASEPRTTGVSLAVASPKGGVGKTTIALNLGISLAHQGWRVIVIDADINGDLLSLINARGSAELGTYDLLHGSGQLDAALRRTVVSGLRVLPATGRELSASAMQTADRTAKWRELIHEATSLADVVLLDCPAGMSTTSLDIMHGVSHVLGVFQAETVASRSFEMFERGLAAVGDRARPNVVGVVVNMLREDAASSRVYDTLKTGDTGRHVLRTAIGRSESFEDAAATGVPVRLHDSDASRKVAMLFDALAAEVAARLGLVSVSEQAARSFML